MESRIQSYLRFAASQQRDTERIGPFLATFSRHSANPYLNYAIPDDGAAPSLADVNALLFGGGALTARLLREAFDAGVAVAFLMAGHEEEFRVYTRAGFCAIGEILHISLPPNLITNP
ncbi:hypothetical protein QT970_11950 [Microcoleus sp. herbarium8]|uniref:hypothetical protein n=1 Tax=Microcoleus sp. herbarium8 TaxID=3055436 RepID=UPI002FD2CBD0